MYSGLRAECCTKRGAISSFYALAVLSQLLVIVQCFRVIKNDNIPINNSSIGNSSHFRRFLKGCTSNKSTGNYTSRLEFSKDQIEECVNKFFRYCEELQDKCVREYLSETSGFKYLVELLKNVYKCDEVDSLVEFFGLNRYKSFTVLLDKNALLEQVMSIVDHVKKENVHEMRFFGIPIAVKDNIAVEGVPLMNGSNALNGFVSSYSAHVVEMLRKNGAIIIGKTTLDEFGVGSEIAETTNPFNSDYSTGGSSGGSAAAVGGGIVSCGICTDTGGSARLAAAYCGCVGFRPSYGLFSRFGVSELCSKFDTIGTITSNVKEAGLLMYCMLKSDPRDMNSVQDVSMISDEFDQFLRSKNVSKESLGVKVATFDLNELFCRGYIEKDVMQNMEFVEDFFKTLGAEIVIVDTPSLETVAASYHIYVASQMATNLQRFQDFMYGHNYYRDYREFISQFRRETIERMELGVDMLERDRDYPEKVLRSAKKYLSQWVEKNKLFEDVEFLITPTSPTCATPKKKPQSSIKDGNKINPLKKYFYTTISPILGVCSIAIPSGINEKKLPQSFQITAGRLRDARLLEVASLFEGATGFQKKLRNSLAAIG